MSSHPRPIGHGSLPRIARHTSGAKGAEGIADRYCDDLQLRVPRGGFELAVCFNDYRDLRGVGFDELRFSPDTAGRQRRRT
jgi:hypothetical protein